MRDPGNDLPALMLVVQRPWELSRKDLRDLKLALDQRCYNETSLTSAWRDTTNQTKAITIVDPEVIDDDALFFRREGGGWNRLNRMFDDQLDDVLQRFQREVWAA